MEDDKKKDQHEQPDKGEPKKPDSDATTLDEPAEPPPPADGDINAPGKTTP